MSDKSKEFAKASKQQGNRSLISEILGFLSQSKKWWMLPIIIVMLLLGILIILGGTGAAPFIYTLF